MSITTKIDAMGSARCDAAAVAITANIIKLAKQASGIMATAYAKTVPDLLGLSSPEMLLTIQKVKAALKKADVPQGTLNVTFTVIGYFAREGIRLPDTFKVARSKYDEAREAKADVGRAPRPPKGEKVDKAPPIEAIEGAVGIPSDNQVQLRELMQVWALLNAENRTNVLERARNLRAEQELEAMIALDAADSIDLESSEAA